VHGRPSEIFKEHVYVSPHHYGEDIGGLMALLGPERVLFGSDFPHAEGMSGAGDYQERVGELVARLGRPEHEVRLLLRDNGRRAVGLAG
jgi:predicted TIM-barrel fold metal-dependent hydrolase